MTETPVLTHVIYRPKKGREADLQTLVEKHWPTIHALGLATDDPATVYRATDHKTGAVCFIEIFSWKDENASGIAHQTPEVMSVWEPMDAVLEDLQITKLDPLE